MTDLPAAPPPAPVPAGPDRLIIRQRLTLMVNRYEIHTVVGDWQEGPLLAVAQQKRMAFKEQVTFYTDESRTQPVFAFKARRTIDLGSGYDVTDAHGQAIGFFKKQFGASLLRSTWDLQTPDGLTSVGQERNQTIAVLRRIWDIIPIVGGIPVPFLFHFDFVAGDGTRVLSSMRKAGLRDTYRLELPEVNGWRIDWRVAAAMGVALDALQSR
ncbi:MAG: hypothetical protein IPL94_07550 [Tetrasphaera sp.]|nr:hypothetical protein [Tetrasphaera sp.]